jgi:hypothetical protein
MPRARKRDWQPKGIEIFDTHDLISDEALVSLITQRFSSSCSQEKLAQLQSRLRWIAGRLRAGLHYRSRPTPGEISAGLKPLAKCVAATIAALEALDADTRRLLENEFDQSAGEVEIILDGEKVGYQVKADALNVYGVRSRLKVLEKLIASAKQKLGPPKSPRKIRLVDETSAIHALLKVWRDAAKGTSNPPCPTEKQFVPFVTEILGPVLAPYGVKTSLKGLINEALYGKKESNKNTGT